MIEVKCDNCGKDIKDGLFLEMDWTIKEMKDGQIVRPDISDTSLVSSMAEVSKVSVCLECFFTQLLINSMKGE